MDNLDRNTDQEKADREQVQEQHDELQHERKARGDIRDTTIEAGRELARNRNETAQVNRTNLDQSESNEAADEAE